MPSISVIVPVYQAEKFLHRCLDSVARQTFSDWELILVDDGSTDGSAALCDRFAAKDNRVRVFHRKKNQGVSEARNLGINEAKGDYIAFLDADDCYEFQALETLWNLREQSGADAAACGLTYLWPGGKQSVQAQLPAGVYGGAEIREKLVLPLTGDRLTQPVFNGYSVCYLFSTELIRKNHIAFDGPYLEDELFVLEYFCNARTLAVTDQPLYRYFLHGFWKTSLACRSSTSAFVTAIPHFSSPRTIIVSPARIWNTSLASFGMTICPRSPTFTVPKM